MDYEYLINQALTQYPISNPNIELIRHNENLTCKVIDQDTEDVFVLRIHLPKVGFSQLTAQHSYESLSSEIKFIQAIGKFTDIIVQKPVINLNDSYITILTDHKGKDIYATLLTWVHGEMMNQDDPNWEQLAYLTGIMIAKLHDFSSKWDEGKSIKRHHYDILKVRNVITQIEEAIDLGLMREEHYRVIKQGGEKIIEMMKELDRRQDTKGLIHADIQKTNLIVHNETVTPIDFGLCGHGYFYMDIGGTSADFAPLNIRKALLNGYQTIREIPKEDMKYIEGFFVLVILLAMATHLHNPNMKEWYLRRTEPICNEYIKPLISNENFYEII